MTIRDFFSGFSHDMANITICDSNYDLLMDRTVHFTNDDYKFQEFDTLADRLIKSWFVNLRGEIFIIVF